MSSNIIFQIKSSKITRGHDFTLVKEQDRVHVRMYSFSQRTFNVWNKLSTGCLLSVNMVKNAINTYLVLEEYVDLR